jgi:polyphenol oxidase
MIVAVALLRSDTLARAGFLHAFPERGATDAELFAAVGVAVIAQAKQVHGARAIEALEATGALGSEADALVGRASRAWPAAVGVRVADCVPVLVADEASGDVAAIHAGWRGVVAGVVPAAVDLLTAPPRASLMAAIGPSIGGCCFEVGRDVAASIVRASGAPQALTDERGDRAYIDLRAAVRAQLLGAGVSADRIDDVPGCTKHESTRFHSFRRDGARSGRMLAAIATRSTLVHRN